jgi:hypothetical protein
MTAKNLKPIKAILALTIALGKDALAIKSSGNPILTELPLLSNLFGPGAAAVAELKDFPGSLDGFGEDDAAQLVAYAVEQGAVSNDHAKLLVQDALDLAALVVKIIGHVENKQAVA